MAHRLERLPTYQHGNTAYSEDILTIIQLSLIKLVRLNFRHAPCGSGSPNTHLEKVTVIIPRHLLDANGPNLRAGHGQPELAIKTGRLGRTVSVQQPQPWLVAINRGIDSLGEVLGLRVCNNTRGRRRRESRILGQKLLDTGKIWGVSRRRFSHDNNG